MSLPRVSNNPRYDQCRSEAFAQYIKGKLLCEENDCMESIDAFKAAIDQINLIPELDRDDTDYRGLAQYYNYIAVRQRTRFDTDGGDESIAAAVAAYKNSAAMRLKMMNPSEDDINKVAGAHKQVFFLLNPIIMGGIVSDEFDLVCEQNIQEITKERANRTITDEDQRCLARWHFGLSQSYLRTDSIAQLNTAITLIGKIIKLIPEDYLDKALYHFELAKAATKIGQNKDASDNCKQAFLCLDACKTDSDTQEQKDEIKNLFDTLGNPPINNPVKSVLKQNSFWGQINETLTNVIPENNSNTPTPH